MKAKIFLGFMAGLALMGVIWYNSGDPFEVAPTSKPVFITETKTREVEVPAQPSRECHEYVRAVLALRDGQRNLSRTKGGMESMMVRLKANANNRDSISLVDVQRQMRVLKYAMDNAWVEIGMASATIDSYGRSSPCLEAAE